MIYRVLPIDTHTMLEGKQNGMIRKGIILQLNAHTLGLPYLQYRFPVSVTYSQPWLRNIKWKTGTTSSS